MVTPSQCCGVAYCAAAAGIDTLISAAKTPRTPTRRRPFPASDEDRNSCELFAMKLNSPTSEILPGCSFMSAPATAPSPVKPFQDDSLILQPLSGRGRIQRGTLHAKMNTRADRLRLPPTDGKREKSLRARSVCLHPGPAERMAAVAALAHLTFQHREVRENLGILWHVRTALRDTGLRAIDSPVACL